MQEKRRHTGSEQGLGPDVLAEDLFGLNIRGLRTIWTMIRRPRKGFSAARQPDWEDRYTPSIRLAFSLLALIGFLSFLYLSPDGFLMVLIREALSESSLGLDAEATKRVSEQIADIYAATVAPLYLLLFAVAAWALRIWGPGTNWVLRLRLYFLALVPNLVITVLALPPTGLIPADFAIPFSLLTFAITWAADIITALRGGVYGQTGLGRAIRAISFGLTNVVMGSLAGSIGFTIATNIAVARLPA